MLTRQSYYEEKREVIKQLVLTILRDLIDMTEAYERFLKNPCNDSRDFILNTENEVNENEKIIEKHIFEIISLEQLDTNKIKWLLSMNKIIRDLERIGDQLTNIITISDIVDTDEIRPIIKQFFHYEKDMLKWLIDGIQTNNSDKLENVISHDRHVNILNKQTYKSLVETINENEGLTESRIKVVIISRFLERIGDHLVNIAKAYKKLTDEKK